MPHDHRASRRHRAVCRRECWGRVATAKLAGAFGLLVGLAGFPRLGLAAGVGLIVFFVGALAAHLRAHVLYNIAFPGLYLALAVAATTYFAASP